MTLRQASAVLGAARRRGLASQLDGLSHALARWSIHLSPRAVSLEEGLRAAASCAFVMGVVELVHWPALAWAAISALWTCLADPGGEPRRRLHIMLGYTAFSTLFAVVGAGAAGLGLAFSAPALFLCALAAGAAGAWGMAARQCGVLALVACAVAIDSPTTTLLDLVRFGAIFSGGCLWATFLSLTVWRIHPFRPARQAIAGSYVAMADLTADLGLRAAEGQSGAAETAAWARVTVRHRSAVRSAIETARTAIEELLRARRQGPVTHRLMLALAMAERIFTELIALEDLVQSARGLGNSRARARHIHVLALMLRRMARWLLDQSVHDLKAGPKLATLLGEDHWPGAAILATIAEDLVGFESRRAAPPTRVAPIDGSDLLGPLRRELRWTSGLARQALRCAILVTSLLICARLAGLPKAYWATMAVILVHQGQLATTWPRALERSLGSALGGVIALAIGLQLHSSLSLTIAVFPLAMLTMAMRRVNYTLFVVFITPLFVTISELSQPAASPATLGTFRVIDNVLGCAVAMAGTVLLWPVDPHQRLTQAIASAIAANGRYARLALASGADETERDNARRVAGLASIEAESAAHRASLEGGAGAGALEIAEDILAMVRQITGGVTLAWLHPEEGTRAPADDLADWLGRTTELLADSLRKEVPHAGEWPAPPPAACRAQTVQRLAALRRAVLDYLAARRQLSTEVVG